MPNGHSPLIVPPAPLEALAAELGADAARIEREIRLELRAALAEHELRVRALEQQIAEQAAQLAAAPGPPGPRGDDGAPGPAGESGPPGAPGLLPAAGEWRARVHYAAAVVTHAGATWQAIRDTGTEPGGDDWRQLAAPGSDGRTPAFRGAWKAASAYEALDVVMVGGSSFVALSGDPGPCPGDGWRLVASRGSEGPRGATGATGERGYPGPPAPAPKALAVDDAGILTLTLADGSTLVADFYPLLIRHA